MISRVLHSRYVFHDDQLPISSGPHIVMRVSSTLGHPIWCDGLQIGTAEITCQALPASRHACPRCNPAHVGIFPLVHPLYINEKESVPPMVL